ncbi:MAG: phage portal protein [Alicycliphilus sp.]|nr:phage portal protein [Alicycliphilus sp.]
MRGGLGVEYAMTLEDAEWIEARKFSVIEVARLFRVPPVIIQSMESANYSNSVELARQFVTLCLRRHLVAWEQAIHRQLLTEAGRRTYFVEHGVEGLLRGDSTTRASFYESAIQNGWMEVNEVRRLENLPPLERKFQPMQAPKGAAR